MEQSKLSIAEIMKAAVVSIDEHAKVAAALELAEKNGVHHFPVLSGGNVVGLVCACDLDDAAPETEVREHMRGEVLCFAPATPAEVVALEMAEARVGSVVVSDGARVCGVVAREDLAEVAQQHQLFLDAHQCACCGVRPHRLRVRDDGQLLCSDCAERSRADEWYELGVAG